MYNFQLQANGLDERFNQTLQSMLVKFVAEKQKHWDDFLDTCTIGAKHPEVFAYDSLLCTAPDHLQQQIAALLKTGEKAMQTNGSDCGVHAIAYATALCLRVSPAKLQFDENAMRPHLIKCLQDGRFTMFPVRKTCRKAIVKATQCIPIHCIC